MKERTRIPSRKTDDEAPTLMRRNIGFTGNAREYFGIWIVNLTLSIITLGIYSAWAKVRRETYFKNNTRIVDDGFGYHATGGQILKGRLIAFAVLVALNIISTFEPIAGAALIPVLLFLIPWILNNSMRFSARMTSYRNIRFNWHGTYWKTFWFLMIAPIFGLLTLGLLIPLISKSYYSYFARSHSYGTSRFSCRPRVGEYYLAFLIGGVLPSALLSVLIFTLITIGQELGVVEGTVKVFDNPNSLVVWIALPIALYVSIFSISYGVLCRNLMMKSLVLTGVANFDSTISPVRFIWISLSNSLAIILSVGLLLPWAKVRMYSYLADSTQVEVDAGNLEKYVDEAKAVRSSFGEEIAEFEGIEVTI